MQKTTCDAILQFGIWQDVQIKDDETFQRVVSKVLNQNKILDNNTNFNWGQTFSGILPQGFAPAGLPPMSWDGTFNVNGTKRKYISEAISDQFSDSVYYHRFYENIARTASPEIVGAWSDCIKGLNENRRIHSVVSYPELIPDNTQPISIRIDITKYSAGDDPGTKIYLSKNWLKKTLEAQDLHLRSDSFIEEKALLRERLPKSIIVVVPPSQRGKFIDLPIVTNDDRYSGWVSFIAPLSAESPLIFTPPVEVAHISGGDCHYRIQNDFSTRMIARINARFVCKLEHKDPISIGTSKFRMIDRTDNSSIQTIHADLSGRGHHVRDFTVDIHISPRSYRDILAQFLDYYGLVQDTMEITLTMSHNQLEDE